MHECERVVLQYSLALLVAIWYIKWLLLLSLLKQMQLFQTHFLHRLIENVFWNLYRIKCLALSGLTLSVRYIYIYTLKELYWMCLTAVVKWLSVSQLPQRGAPRKSLVVQETSKVATETRAFPARGNQSPVALPLLAIPTKSRQL